MFCYLQYAGRARVLLNYFCIFHISDSALNSTVKTSNSNFWKYVEIRRSLNRVLLPNPVTYSSIFFMLVNSLGSSGKSYLRLIIDFLPLCWSVEALVHVQRQRQEPTWLPRFWCRMQPLCCGLRERVLIRQSFCVPLLIENFYCEYWVLSNGSSVSTRKSSFLFVKMLYFTVKMTKWPEVPGMISWV